MAGAIWGELERLVQPAGGATLEWIGGELEWLARFDGRLVPLELLELERGRLVRF